MQSIVPPATNGYKLLAVVLTRTVHISEEITIAFGEDSWSVHDGDDGDDEEDGEEGITATSVPASTEPARASVCAEAQAIVSTEADHASASAGVRTGRKRAAGMARSDSRATKRCAGASDSSTHGAVATGEGSASPYLREESRLANSESNRSGGCASSSSAVVLRRHRRAVVRASASAERRKSNNK